MEALELFPFQDSEIQRMEEFDSSTFRMKGLRIKDLHKRLCSAPCMRVRLVQNADTISAPTEDEQNGEENRPVYRFDDNTDHALSDTELDDEVVITKVRLPPSKNVDRDGSLLKVPRAEKLPLNPRARKPTVKQTRAPPSKFPDAELRNPNERDRRFFEHGGGDAPKRLATKSRVLEHRRFGARFVEVPVHTQEANDYALRAGSSVEHARLLSKSADVDHHVMPRTQVYGSRAPPPMRGAYRPAAKQARLPATSKYANQGRVGLPTVFFEDPLMEADSESEPSENRSKNHESGLKWSCNFPDVFATEMQAKKKGGMRGSKPKGGSLSLCAVNGGPARIKGRTNVRKLKGGYTSDNPSSEVEADIDNRDTKYPSFTREMKYSNVVTCFWLSIPTSFSKEHLPDTDRILELEDDTGLKWESNYLVRKSGLSGGWRRFSLDHRLEEGDNVLFELIKPLKFKVYVTRVSEGGRAMVIASDQRTQGRIKAPEPPPNSTVYERNSGMVSAMVAARKRGNRDNCDSKFYSRNLHLAIRPEEQQDDLTQQKKAKRLLSSQEVEEEDPLSQRDVFPNGESNGCRDYYTQDKTPSRFVRNGGEELKSLKWTPQSKSKQAWYTDGGGRDCRLDLEGFCMNEKTSTKRRIGSYPAESEHTCQLELMANDETQNRGIYKEKILARKSALLFGLEQQHGERPYSGASSSRKKFKCVSNSEYARHDRICGSEGDRHVEPEESVEVDILESGSDIGEDFRLRCGTAALRSCGACTLKECQGDGHASKTLGSDVSRHASICVDAEQDATCCLEAIDEDVIVMTKNGNRNQESVFGGERKKQVSHCEEENDAPWRGYLHASSVDHARSDCHDKMKWVSAEKKRNAGPHNEEMTSPKAFINKSRSRVLDEQEEQEVHRVKPFTLTKGEGPVSQMFEEDEEVKVLSVKEGWNSYLAVKNQRQRFKVRAKRFPSRPVADISSPFTVKGRKSNISENMSSKISASVSLLNDSNDLKTRCSAMPVDAEKMTLKGSLLEKTHRSNSESTKVKSRKKTLVIGKVALNTLSSMDSHDSCSSDPCTLRREPEPISDEWTPPRTDPEAMSDLWAPPTPISEQFPYPFFCPEEVQQCHEKVFTNDSLIYRQNGTFGSW